MNDSRARKLAFHKEKPEKPPKLEEVYYILAELSDIEEKWLCSTCYWEYYSARPILETMSAAAFQSEMRTGPHPDHCRECGV